MIEHLAPVAADHGDLSPLGLASISRELSANNDPQAIARHVGQADSLNVELALTAPFDLRRAGIGSSVAPSEEPTARDTAITDGDELPLPVLVSAGAAALGATAVGALALRTRRMRARDAQAPEEAAGAEGSDGEPES